MTEKQVEHVLGNGDVIIKTRLYAGEGKALTNDGETLWNCIDVDSSEGWYEVDAPLPTEEAEETDYQEALNDLGVKI